MRIHWLCWVDKYLGSESLSLRKKTQYIENLNRRSAFSDLAYILHLKLTITVGIILNSQYIFACLNRVELKESTEFY